MNDNIDYFTPSIQFRSFIALNRYMDRQILTDSKLFILMIYIALRVKRSNKVEENNWDGVKLNVGEFIIGRHSAVRDTDLSEMEYRSRIKRLQTLNIIGTLQPTNKYTKGVWLENAFIDLNLEVSLNQQNNQQPSDGLTTTNNLNNSNNPVFVVINSINTSTYSTDNYIKVITAYMQHKGIELKGEEIKEAFWVVKKMFDSDRKPAQIIGFMKWLHGHEGLEDHKWINNWTIRTVQSKLPEHLANKLTARTMDDEYPEYR